MTIVPDLLCQIDIFHAPPHTSDAFPLHCKLQFAFAERFACGLISLPQKHCVSNKSHSVSMHSNHWSQTYSIPPRNTHIPYIPLHISLASYCPKQCFHHSMSVFLGLMPLHHPKNGLPNNHCSAIVFRLGPGGLLHFERWKVVRSKLAGCCK
jgi:hypothetical protein